MNWNIQPIKDDNGHYSCPCCKKKCRGFRTDKPKTGRPKGSGCKGGYLVKVGEEDDWTPYTTVAKILASLANEGLTSDGRGQVLVHRIMNRKFTKNSKWNHIHIVKANSLST